MAGLAAAEEWLTGPVQDVNVDDVGNRIEPEDGIGLPIDAGDPCIVERNGFVQCPAHRLQDCAFDLVDQAVWIDDLAAIHRRHRTHQTRLPGLAVYFHLAGNSAISGEILVASKSKAVSAIARRLLSFLPAEALSCFFDHLASARIV